VPADALNGQEPDDCDPPEPQSEGRGAFGGFIGPRTLVQLVRVGAPYVLDGTHARLCELPATGGARLHQHGFHPLGWWSILMHAGLLEAQAEPTPEARTDYFALCLAAHWATVASYVPTDVDAKIRHALWFEGQPPGELAIMRDLALALSGWDVRGFSARSVEVEGFGAVSGHDGERLSVQAGGLLGLLAAGDVEGAASLEAAIDGELAREAAAFDRVARSKGDERRLCGLATVLTHNAGDVMQGLAAKSGRHVGEAQKLRFGELARERFERYGGAFGRAAAIYRELLAGEGHRHYPLREEKLLRAHPDLLLPFGPFLDEWGARLATWPRWSSAQRASVVGALLEGCRKVKGQEGYFRALAGFDAAHPGGLESRELAAELSNASKRALKDSELRRKIAVPRVSFESSCAKRVRAILAAFR
jgi:hypothetical protein